MSPRFLKDMMVELVELPLHPKTRLYRLAENAFAKFGIAYVQIDSRCAVEADGDRHVRQVNATRTKDLRLKSLSVIRELILRRQTEQAARSRSTTYAKRSLPKQERAKRWPLAELSDADFVELFEPLSSANVSVNKAGLTVDQYGDWIRIKK